MSIYPAKGSWTDGVAEHYGLTPVQARALVFCREVRSGGVSYGKATVGALEKKGLATGGPTVKGTGATMRLTGEGERVADRLLAAKERYRQARRAQWA